MARIKPLSIYGYTDYRLYLADYYVYRKQLPGGYSYRTFSRDAGFSSPNILKLVIENKRNIGEKSLHSFAAALKLDSRMADYFSCLVKMNQSVSDTEKETFLKKIRLLTPHSKKRKLGTEGFDYLNHWLNPVIREMVTLDGFNADPYRISRSLYKHASIDEITKSLQFLIKEKFISINDDGQYIDHEAMILSSDEIKNLSIRNYHRKMLDLAKEMIQVLEIDEREYGALTMKVPRNKIHELKEKIKAFRQDIHLWSIEQIKSTHNADNTKISEASDGDVIVQLNMQMFPLSKVNDKK